MAELPARRVAPPVLPDGWSLPRGCEGDPPSVQDAVRQASFLLKRDLALAGRAFEVQQAVAKSSYAGAYRTPRAVAAWVYWSRTAFLLGEAATAAVRAAYAAVPPLIRSACEHIAALRQAPAGDFAAFSQWATGAFQPDAAHRGVQVGLGEYMAGSALASDPALGALYRVTSELTRVHFGVAALFAAAESDRQRFEVAWLDRTFHLGLAECTLGWTLVGLRALLESLVGLDGVLAVSQAEREGVAGWSAEVAVLLADPGRCRVEESDDGERRLFVEQFRRRTGGAPRRLVL